MKLANWGVPDPELESYLLAQNRAAINAYAADPDLIHEHANQEDSYRTGGYANRQLLELVQNAADALLRSGKPGRVELRLAGGVLYCANEGEPFTHAGLRAVCHAFLSSKKGDEIGRFGLGFKSVLAITDKPQIFSRTIALAFNAEADALAIQSLAHATGPLPLLRVPSSADIHSAAADDPILAELAEWATTVIKLPIVAGGDLVYKQMAEFRTEFLLFTKSVASLRLVIGIGESIKLDVTHSRTYVSEDHVELSTPSGKKSEWIIAETVHRPSEQALEEVGRVIARDEVTVTYALPLEGSNRGEFWAYFPLSDLTTATGIFNAPWRVNDDRTSMIAGLFNSEMLAVAAHLMLMVLPRVSTEKDPAKHFDYLPARGREILSGGDRTLSEIIPRLARTMALVPDARGELKKAGVLTLPDLDRKIEFENLKKWQDSRLGPDSVPHWTCYSTDTRRSRLRGLIRAEDNRASNEVAASSWIEYLVRRQSLESSSFALSVVASLSDESARKAASQARIIPTVEGELFRADDTDSLYIAGDTLIGSADICLIDSAFASHGDNRRHLIQLGFLEVSPTEELKALCRGSSEHWQAEDWSSFWSLVGRVPPHSAQEILSTLSRGGTVVKVKCLDGEWRFGTEVIVPDAQVVTPRDSSLCVDARFHHETSAYLHLVGAVSSPVTLDLADDPVYVAYRERQFALALAETRSQAWPFRGAKFVIQRGIGPLHPLKRFRMGGDSAACLGWTTALLKAPANDLWSLTVHSRAEYVTQVEAPHIWAMREYGILATSWGERDVRACIDSSLNAYSEYLPIALSPYSHRLNLWSTLEDVPQNIWLEFVSRTPQSADPRVLGRLLELAARKLKTSVVPDQIPAIVGSQAALTAPSRVIIAETSEAAEFFRARVVPHIVIEDADQASALARQWGCRLSRDTLSSEIVPENAGEAVVALDKFRGLRQGFKVELDGIEIAHCDSVVRRHSGPDGVEDEVVSFALQGRILYVERGLDDEELLGAISHEFSLNLYDSDIARIIKDEIAAAISRRLEECRQAPSPQEKLLVLLPRDVLERKLPKGLLHVIGTIGGGTADSDVADLYMTMNGLDSLFKLRDELETAGFRPPKAWSASTEAVKFVKDLGFPTAYAGSRQANPPAMMQIAGRPGLRPLHDFQVELAAQIRSLIFTRDSTGTAGKAMLFLPTGAGKTRVTVEAIVRAILEDGLQGPILWVAQSGELCEQAVQTWSDVWREFGDQRVLELCRLWSTSEVDESILDIQVVVATDAKLDELLEKVSYDWLSEPSIVVIDEAHRAGASPRYTRILKWMGIDARRAARPLLGLTATPFKGRSPEVNRSLATRFGERKLDAHVLGEDPYGALQDLGVLSRVHHRTLEGADVHLNAQESRDVQTMRMLPKRVLDQLGQDDDRTIRLMDDILALDATWPVLVFTANVAAAHFLAALLTTKGVKAAAVEGGTRRHERRRIIEQFRSGEIRVLINCHLLTQGFDAPAVRALYIARPTFSPNDYIQMVGRGLRGPMNGGKEECLVVNVEDTFGAFGEQLAFREFDYLWNPQGAV